MNSIHFLNADLDLEAGFDLGPLTGALSARGLFTLHCWERSEGIWEATCESSRDTLSENAETTILELLESIENLDAESRKAWLGCSRREFNLGYDCGDEPWAFNNAVSVESLARMAALGIAMRMTIYPVRPPPCAEGQCG